MQKEGAREITQIEKNAGIPEYQVFIKEIRVNREPKSVEARGVLDEVSDERLKVIARQLLGSKGEDRLAYQNDFLLKVVTHIQDENFLLTEVLPGLSDKTGLGYIQQGDPFAGGLCSFVNHLTRRGKFFAAKSSSLPYVAKIWALHDLSDFGEVTSNDFKEAQRQAIKRQKNETMIFDNEADQLDFKKNAVLLMLEGEEINENEVDSDGDRIDNSIEKAEEEQISEVRQGIMKNLFTKIDKELVKEIAKEAKDSNVRKIAEDKLKSWE